MTRLVAALVRRYLPSETELAATFAERTISLDSLFTDRNAS